MTQNQNLETEYSTIDDRNSSMFEDIITNGSAAESNFKLIIKFKNGSDSKRIMASILNDLEIDESDLKSAPIFDSQSTTLNFSSYDLSTNVFSALNKNLDKYCIDNLEISKNSNVDVDDEEIEIISNRFQRNDSLSSLDSIEVIEDSRESMTSSRIYDSNEHTTCDKLIAVDKVAFINDEKQKTCQTECCDEVKMKSSNSDELANQILSSDNLTKSKILITRRPENDNNFVDFQFNKPIKDEDLKKIIVFLEHKPSGGGKLANEYKLDSKNNLLTVEFKSYATKRRIMQKRSITFLNYRLFTNQSFRKEDFSQDLKVMMIHKFPVAFDIESIKMFAENLVIDDEEEDEDEDIEDYDYNKINAIFESKIFPGIYIAHFKREYDLKMVLNELEAKRQDYETSILDAYETNFVLIRSLNFSKVKLNIDSIEAYLISKCNAKLSYLSPYRSIRLMQPFVLVKYDSDADLGEFLKLEHLIDGEIYLIEKLYNYDLLATEIDRLNNFKEDSSPKAFDESQILTIQNEEEQQTQSDNDNNGDAIEMNTTSSDINLNESSINQEPDSDNEIDLLLDNHYYKRLFDPVPNGDADEIGNPDDLKIIKLTSLNYPKIKVLFRWNEFFFDQFNELLQKFGAEMHSVQTSKEIFISISEEKLSKLQNNEKRNLKSNIQLEINKFFEQFDYKCLKLLNKTADLCIKFLKKISYDDEKVHQEIKQLLNDSIVEIYGMNLQVNEFTNELLSELKIMNIEFISDYKIKEEDLKAEPIVTERVELSPIQKKLIFVFKYMNEMAKKYPSMTVSLEANNLTLNGSLSDVKRGKVCLKKIIGSVVHSDYTFQDTSLFEFYLKNEKEIVSWLKENNHLCVIMPDQLGFKLKIFSIRTQCIEKLEQDLDDTFVSFPLDPRKYYFVNSNPRLLITNSNGQKKLCGFKKDCESFLSRNNIE